MEDNHRPTTIAEIIRDFGATLSSGLTSAEEHIEGDGETDVVHAMARALLWYFLVLGVSITVGLLLLGTAVFWR